MTTTLHDIARLLLAARVGGDRTASTHWPLLLQRPADAYAVQDATLAALGPIGGWKVGAANPDVTPHCAPLPAQGILPSGSLLPTSRHPASLLELEVSLRVGSDLLDVGRDLPTPSELAQCFDAVLPAIEVVDTRLAEGREAPTLAKLADLQSHGALVIGVPSADMALDAVDLRTVQATLWFGDECAARTIGGNPSQDVWRLVGWLARHCSERGVPLRKGQIVTTGSCTGMIAAPVEGVVVRGAIVGIGGVQLQFGS